MKEILNKSLESPWKNLKSSFEHCVSHIIMLFPTFFGILRQMKLMLRVESLETKLTKLSIDISADSREVKDGLMTAQEEMQGLRTFTADQLTTLDKQLLGISKAMEDMKMMMMTTKMACSVDELSEQTTASAVDGDSESGIASAKQDALGNFCISNSTCLFKNH